MTLMRVKCDDEKKPWLETKIKKHTVILSRGAEDDTMVYAVLNVEPIQYSWFGGTPRVQPSSWRETMFSFRNSKSKWPTISF